MSISTAQARALGKRPYRLQKRAEKQLETRQRIVEAAIDLHGTIGPARTSIAQIAERAGVQRHTFYAHFPDDRSLFLACSGLAMERDPLPAADRWLAHPAGGNRICHGLEELYAWYARNEGMVACVLRDAEVHQPTREIVDLRMKPAFDRAVIILGEGLRDGARALLGLAVEFACWRNLSRSQSSASAARLMTDSIGCLAHSCSDTD